MYQISVPGIQNAFQIKNFYFGGQPDNEGLQYFVDEGVKKIFNLRNTQELDFGFEEEFMRANPEVEYFHLPIIIDGGFSEECVNTLNALQEGDDCPKVLIHCASGNRIGAWYVIYCNRVKGMSLEESLEEGSKAGLTNPALGQLAVNYIQNLI